MTPSERAALVAQIAVQLDARRVQRPEDGNPIYGATETRVNRLCREAANWLAAAERVTAERHPARPDMAEAVGGTDADGDDLNT